jgi:hypothetical protein
MTSTFREQRELEWLVPLAYAATEAVLFAWRDTTSALDPSVAVSLRTPRMIIRQMTINGDVGQRDVA